MLFWERGGGLCEGRKDFMKERRKDFMKERRKDFMKEGHYGGRTLWREKGRKEGRKEGE